MDIATIIGMVSAFGLVVAAILMGSGLGLFVDPPSLLIVVGGTFGATLINYPLKEVLGTTSVIKNAFFAKTVKLDEINKQFVEYATKARREGILALEAEVRNIQDDFLKKGLQLSVDGLEPQSIQNILSTDIEYLKSRHSLGAEVLTTMGTFAPALGMIGTLVGLVQMLQSMDDPSKIGPAMAIALLTTFYGSVLANLICMPLAGKLRTRSKEETLIKEMILEGIVSLTNGDNPRILEQKLLAFLPPKLRQTSFK
ncbi:MAG: MotA/TolQ/ExbB proton channel family protein [Desulfobacterales bacterium]|nr:MotA/TolQ/ExbB proton channel family protein [Desulfobacterales bacterium]